MKDGKCPPGMPPSFVKEEAKEGHPSMKKLAKDMGRKAKRSGTRKSSR